MELDAVGPQGACGVGSHSWRGDVLRTSTISETSAAWASRGTCRGTHPLTPLRLELH